MAWQGLATEFLQVPVVTRAYTAACVLTTAAVVRRPAWGGGRLGWFAMATARVRGSSSGFRQGSLGEP